MFDVLEAGGTKTRIMLFCFYTNGFFNRNLTSPSYIRVDPRRENREYRITYIHVHKARTTIVT